MENKDKTKFTLEHAQTFFQTLADIVGKKYDIQVIAKVKEKAGVKNEKQKKIRSK